MTKEQILTELEQYNLADPNVKKILVGNLSDRIKQKKLPYKLILENFNYQLVEVGESTEAFLNRFITVNSHMLRLKDEIRKLAAYSEEDDTEQLYSVLITGPTGTGKELIARALHGERNDPFVPVNCAGLSPMLIESILFGHMAGSFTGATDTREGLLKAAKNGTFFLDEMGELPIELQAKFLRAIQNRRVRKVGSNKEEPINCRIVCATNKNLFDMAKSNQFRLDLYARISQFELHTTALADRPEDIEPIMKSISGGKEFIEAFNTANAMTGQLLKEIDTTLNVRSLQQHIKRFKVLGRLP